MKNYDTIDNLMREIWQESIDRQLKASKAYSGEYLKDERLAREYRDAIIAQETIFNVWQQLKVKTLAKVFESVRGTFVC